MMIRLATRADVPAMMALEERYYVGNLGPDEQSAGFISILHPRGWFDAAVDSAGVHVAVAEDGAVVGFIAMTDPPTVLDEDSPPIIRAMMELSATLEFRGVPIAQQRFAFRGPVLIDRAARGRGLYAAFNEVTGEAYRDRFDLAVLFVSADNAKSLHTTTTKLNAEPLAVFDVGDRRYHFLAFAF